MALDVCSDCGNSVSSKAKACPKCGRPLNQDNFWVGLVFYLFLIGGGFIVSVLPFSISSLVGGVMIMIGGLFLIILLIRKLFSAIT